MSADRQRRVLEIADRVREADPGSIDDLLARECGDDPALRREVERLLAAGEVEDDALSRPFVRLLDPEATGDPALGGMIGRRIGPYRIRRLLDDSGGMGVVYEAEQEEPRRVVAIKVMRGAHASPGRMRRFREEARTLGRLRHPGVAQVYESGSCDEHGEPCLYIAMELVPGARSIVRFATERDLDLRRRIELFRAVCEAVQHVHERGIIHRDLKPTNLLVDPEGHPKVIDFGVARAMDADVGKTWSRTADGGLVGTPAYMSPEQIRGEPNAVTARSDVYALGIVLFELLTGELPFAATTWTETREAVLTRPPRRPSTVDRRIRRDLETIILTAISRRPEDRYESAAALRRDLECYLAGQPIAARRPSSVYQLWLLARRHRAATCLAVALVVLLTGLGWLRGAMLTRQAELASARQALAFESALRATRERSLAKMNYAQLLGVASAALADRDVATARAMLRQAPEAQRGWEWHHLAGQLDASAEIVAGDPERPRDAQWMDLATTRDGSIVAAASFEGDLHLWRVSGDRLVPIPVARDLPGTEGIASVHAIDVVRRADGRVLLLLGGRSTLRHPRGLLAELEGDRLVVRRTLAVPPSAGKEIPYLGATFDEAGERFALAARESLELYRVDAPDTDPVTWTAGTALREIRDLAFDAAGARLVSAGDDRIVRIWSVDAVEAGDRDPLLVLPHPEKVQAVALSPTDPHLLATAAADGVVRLWNVEPDAAERTPATRLLHTLPSGAASLLAITFRPDGAELVATGAAGAVWSWELAVDRASSAPRLAATARPPRLGHATEVRGAAHDARGVLLTASMDGTIRAWPAKSQAPVVTLAPHGSGVHAVAFTREADGTLAVFTAGGDQRVRRWDARTGALRAELARLRNEAIPRSAQALLVDADRGLLLSGHEDGNVVAWELAAPRLPIRQVVAVPGGRGAGVGALALDPRDGSVLVGGRGSALVRWRREEDTATRLGSVTGWIASIAISRDGQRIALSTGHPETAPRAAQDTASAWLLDREGAVVRELPHACRATAVAFVAGDLIASGDSGGRLRLWTAQGDPVQSIIAHGDAITGIVAMPAPTGDGGRTRDHGRDRDHDRDRFAIASRDGTVSIWAVAEQVPYRLLTLNARPGAVHALAFDADHQALAAVSTGPTGQGNVGRVWWGEGSARDGSP